MIVRATIIVEVDPLAPLAVEVDESGAVEVDLAGDDRVTLRWDSVAMLEHWLADLTGRILGRDRPRRLEDEATRPPDVYGAGAGAEDLEARAQALGEKALGA